MNQPVSADILTHPVVCCGCSQQCGILVDVSDGRVVDIRGDREHPVSQGFICPKGSDAPELVEHAQRLTRPLKRVGPRGSGQWKEVDWDEALDDIAERVRLLTRQHGPETLAYSYGTFRGGDWGIGERFLNRFDSPNACGQDKICLGPLTLGETLTYGMGPTVFTPPVAGTTQTIVLWGMRPSASAPLLWSAIFAARKAGARLVVIDPEKTREAGYADLWLQSRPGRDGELALALLKLVVEGNRYDAVFVREETLGFDALAQMLAEHDLDTLAQACGVPVNALVEVADAIAAGGPTVFNAGNGLCQSGTPALQTGRAIACLIAITGNLDRAGGHTIGGPPRDIRANGLMLDADQLSTAQRSKRLGAAHFPYLGDGYGDVDRAVAQAWHGHAHTMSWMATAHEPSLWRAIVEQSPYAVKALFVQHHNPLGANPHAAVVRDALVSEHLELSVVHEMFMTPTAELADYVLPAAHWLEKPYFSLGLAFLGAFGDYVGANHAALAPPAGVRSDYELWRDLGRRLGQADAWPDSAETFYAQCLAPAELDFATVAAARGPLFGDAARRPTTAGSAPVAARRYGTPSGKVELHSSLLAGWGLAPLPDPVQPALAAHAAAFPLTLTTGGRRIEAFHENAQHMARFRRRHPHPIAELHPATAALAGIAEGDWFTIATPLGAVRQTAHLSTALREEVISADRWWYPEGTGNEDDRYGLWANNINVCTSDAIDDCDPVMGVWLLRGLPCRIAKD